MWPNKKPKHERAVDMDALADHMKRVKAEDFARLRDAPPLERPRNEFAPNPLREMTRAVETIEKFGALPLKELDTALDKLRNEVAELEEYGQTARDIIMTVRRDYLKRLEKAQQVANLTRQSLAKLAEDCAAIDAPPPAPPAEETEQENKSDEQLQPSAT